jgi:carboxylesterase type B
MAESAGAISGCLHEVSPVSRAADIFQRAILQSGDCSIMMLDTRETAEAKSTAFVNSHFALCMATNPALASFSTLAAQVCLAATSINQATDAGLVDRRSASRTRRGTCCSTPRSRSIRSPPPAPPHRSSRAPVRSRASRLPLAPA